MAVYVSLFLGVSEVLLLASLIEAAFDLFTGGCFDGAQPANYSGRLQCGV